MSLVEAVASTFVKLFKEQPLLVRSPGRVNLIGEHTDYNMGYVLPAALDKAIYFAIAPAPGGECRVHALDVNQEHRFSLDALHKAQNGWPNYVMGVVDQLMKAGYPVGGFHCVFGGDIPIGAGLSSSAALEAGLAFALNEIFPLRIDRLTLVKLAQKAENEFVGVQCGIMDQFINIFGAEGKALLIDCRSLEYEEHPFDPGIAIVLFDTRVSHSLASSEYNRRRMECGEGVAALRRRHPEISSLRDVSMAMLAESKDTLDSRVYRRCKYVVEENERVIKACEALEQKDIGAFGRYMFQTHEGLRDEYEVSCPQLDALVDLVREMPQVYGARMMGGGFGGCTVNLIAREAVEETTAEVTRRYKERFTAGSRTYVTHISRGTAIVPGPRAA